VPFARERPGGVASNLAASGGNDPHSLAVTVLRASMNTLRPNFYSQAPRDAYLGVRGFRSIATSSYIRTRSSPVGPA